MDSNAPAALLQLVRSSIERHRWATVGKRWGVALSAGRDSVALLCALHELRQEYELSLHAATVDHGLRDVAAELHFAEALCAELHVPWVQLEVQLDAGRSAVQQRARDARRAALQQWASTERLQLVAVGHTRTDQAETVLMRLVRGSGTRGLAAMRPRSGLFVRPLLDAGREHVDAYLAARGQGWMDDPSNASSAYARNRLRHTVWPALLDWAPAAEVCMARAAENLARDAAVLSALGERVLRESIVDSGAGWLDIRWDRVRSEPAGLWPHVLHQITLRWGRSLHASHVERIVELFQGGGSGVFEAHGLRFERRYDHLRVRDLTREPDFAVKERAQEVDGRPGAGVAHMDLQGLGCFRDDAVGAIVTVDEHPADRFTEPGPTDAWFDAAALRWPLTLRAPARGERMTLLGLEGTKKVSDVLIDAKVPLADRPGALVLVQADEPLWLVGVRRSARAIVGPASSRAVRVRVCRH